MPFPLQRLEQAVGGPSGGAQAARVASHEHDARAANERGNLGGVLLVLMRAYGQDIYRHCRQMLGSDALADDVHQDVFAQAYRDLPRFAGQSSFRTWLYAIARHRCLDALKLRRRFQRRFWPEARVPEATDPVVAADVRLADRSTELLLVEGLRRLKPRARIAILLRFQEEMSYEQMAIVCGERPATLQARVTRALPVLRAWLETQGLTL